MRAASPLRQIERENEMIVISHRLFLFFGRYAIMRNTLGEWTLADGGQTAILFPADPAGLIDKRTDRVIDFTEMNRGTHHG